MLYRFRWVRGFARFAGARMSCDRIAEASWSGPSYCPFSCGHSAAANAARGTLAFSSAQEE
jgi:hypothetical protein